MNPPGTRALVLLPLVKQISPFIKCRALLPQLFLPIRASAFLPGVAPVVFLEIPAPAFILIFSKNTLKSGNRLCRVASMPILDRLYLLALPGLFNMLNPCFSTKLGAIAELLLQV